MRKLFSLCVLFVVPACQQKIVVPTAQELVSNPQLFREWQEKCSTGEYSHLAGVEKDNMCSTTNSAGMTLAQVNASKKESDFFRANTLRK